MCTYEQFLENKIFFRNQFLRLGKMIRYERSKLGLSQKDFAYLVGIDPSNLCKIERGQCGYSVATLLLILRALDLNIKFYEPNS